MVGAPGDGDTATVSPAGVEGATRVGAYPSTTVGTVPVVGAVGATVSSPGADSDSSFHVYGTADGVEGGGEEPRTVLPVGHPCGTRRVTWLPGGGVAGDDVVGGRQGR